MSRLDERMQARATDQAERMAKAMQTFKDRSAKFAKLLTSKEFQEYLKFEEEMYHPDLVLALHCTDPKCEAMKMNIRLFRQRKKALAGAVKASHATHA